MAKEAEDWKASVLEEPAHQREGSWATRAAQVWYQAPWMGMAGCWQGLGVGTAQGVASMGARGFAIRHRHAKS